MPYDNKQCKAYKALKIKYAGYKVNTDGSDNEFTVFGWDNDNQETNVSALVDLNDVKKYINSNGYDTVLDTLLAQNVEYYLDDDQPIKALSSEISKLTYGELLYQLSPTAWSVRDLESAGSDTDVEKLSPIYNHLTSAALNLNSVIAYCTVNVKAHNTAVSAIANLPVFQNVTSSFNDVYPEISGLTGPEADLDLGTMLKVNGKTFGEIFELYENVANAFPALSGTTIPKSVPGLVDAISGEFKDLKLENSSLLSKFAEFNAKIAEARDVIITFNAHQDEPTKENPATKILGELDLLNIYLNSASTSHIKNASGVKALINNQMSGATGLFKQLPSAVVFNYEFECTDPRSVTKIVPGEMNVDKFLDIINTINPVSGLADPNFKVPLTAISGQLSCDFRDTCVMDQEEPVFKITCPYGHEWKDTKTVWENLYLLTKEHTKQCVLGSQEIPENARLLINGKSPFGLNLNEEIIADVLSGSWSDKLSSAISSDLTIAEKQIKTLDKALAQIYNDPYFKKYDGTLKGQAIVDAALLNDPAVAYDYCVYLDSKECTISNEQYDDLVVGNTFTKADRQVSKYGEDIDSANFIIVDKTKSIVNGVGGNNGMFVTVVDPYDALKFQRLLANPENARTLNENMSKNSIAYLGAESDYAWKTMFKTEINTLNSLQRVKNADGLWVGEVNTVPGKEQLMDSWSTPLSDVYENVSISKSLMGMFPQIPLTDTGKYLTDTGKSVETCTIDKQYSSYIIVAVCKTMVNPTDGKITVGVVETFFGSLFDEKNPQTGADLFIGEIINANSKYIEFYKNHYVAPQDVYMPTVASVPQFYIKDSAELNNACKFVGIDQDSYDVDNIYFEYKKDEGWIRKDNCPVEVVYNYDQYIKAINAANIFVFNKKTTILYNNHPYAEFSSFSKKESQKVIADTTGLYGKENGTTLNIANNFMKDMDRCISFIKNIDAIPIYFIADAGLSTIAQFCDNVSWDKGGNSGYGKWVTQNFDPDNDPDSEDRSVTGYESVSTWRKIVDKLDQISREVRRDCMTIIDAPRQLTLDGAAPKIRKSRPDRSWNDVIGEKLIYISGINSSYTAGYYNWLRTTDTFTGKSFWLPPTCKIIGNYMYLNIVNLPWLAPAGHSYGIIPGIHGLSHNPDPNEEDQIYLKSWNYVKQYPFEGFIIEGQKTTLTKNSAFNRVNVRTLFLDLERFTYNVSKRFKYTVNNSYTREQFVQTLKPRFDDYVARGGIYDYRIICDDSNNTPESIDANELRCAIYIKPARLIEYILIDFVCTKTGANLDEIVL